ncbi:MAG: cold-shock protein [Elusimicrobiota bacterium]
MKGIVQFFNNMKNFGFIKPDSGEKDVFVHRSDVQGENLNEGDKVEFEAIDGDKGPKAVNVKRID